MSPSSVTSCLAWNATISFSEGNLAAQEQVYEAHEAKQDDEGEMEGEEGEKRKEKKRKRKST